MNKFVLFEKMFLYLCKMFIIKKWLDKLKLKD